MKSDVLLVLNAGSSSLKFRVFGAQADLPLLANGRITGIGSRPEFIVDGEPVTRLEAGIDQAHALRAIVEWIDRHDDNWRIRAVGHRIVHGGEYYAAPVVLSAQAMENLESLVPLAPLHQPHALAAVRTLAQIYPEPQQVGCFDTAFHASHDPLFREYALPRKLREHGIRRYGFHGLSYEWMAQVLRERHPRLAQGRVVAAHLGNGASLCAMHAGKSIDTTMGMTALDGLPMGTRCGSIDPGVTLYMMRQLGMSGDEIDHVLSHESGLMGLSGISSDMRTLTESDSASARFAIDYFCMMTAQHAARMAVALAGIDALVFTGGIGEHSSQVREAVSRHLAFLGPFEVLVVEADEERMIAGHCLEFA
ncbi:acetate/propionate family kinase [Janthinobacterium sp. 17J80-10]|uniref:acetate/propionate family kinase n=1 Tax=Janthinobacterium sp. 17J80-10 TaxID=2497863 RepID=UPI0010052CFE|nr:acetate/propionate family kinase [Janthinobacterium sp. 17J80-10]QAU32846.1 acetate/propionate family kinase [Janthinobacterium sp. 17J80-10]